MIEALGFLAFAVTLIEGVAWLIRNELARRRARRVVFPPLTTVAVTIDDTIPWE